MLSGNEPHSHHRVIFWTKVFPTTPVAPVISSFIFCSKITNYGLIARIICRFPGGPGNRSTVKPTSFKDLRTAPFAQ